MRARAAPLAVALVVLCVLVPALAGCGVTGAAEAADGPDWSNTDVRVVSKIDAQSGLLAFTSRTPQRRLRTVVVELTTGRTLWTRPATMAGRPPRLGIAPPALVTGRGGEHLAVAVEPRPAGKAGAGDKVLAARAARSGELRWERPLRRSYGARRCGPHVCTQDARHFYLRSAEDGRVRWRAPGPAMVAGTVGRSVVLFRWGEQPAVQRRTLESGRLLWQTRMAGVLGPEVTTAGGWSFSRTGDLLVGRVGQRAHDPGGSAAPFGFFALRLSDGALLWRKHGFESTAPSPRPPVMILAKRVGPAGRPTGFVVVGARTGRVTATLDARAAPGRRGGISLSTDMETLAFQREGGKVVAFALDSGVRVDPADSRLWTFCYPRQQPLPIAGLPDYRSINPVCPVEASSGQTRTDSELPPPEWYTGRVEGWRAWAGPRGALHGLHVGHGGSPGMYLLPSATAR